MRVAVVGFEKDVEKVRTLAKYLNADVHTYEKGIWEKLLDYDCIVALMPAGIVVRQICPLLRSKWVDPAVVVVDKALRFAIPILGGHHGGNEVAKRLEKFGITAVITTAMEFEDGLSVGIGCRKGVKPEDVLEAINRALEEVGATLEDVRVFATAEVKKNENGLIEAIDRVKKPIVFLKKEDLNSVEVPSSSKAKILGINSVAEASALFVSKKKELILPKRVYGGVTIAIAR